MRTTGHKVYVNSVDPHKVFYSQTGCFQLFFISSTAAKNVRFEEETWLEKGSISNYAILDNETFFFKLYLKGGKTAYCQTALYSHLDAAAGRPAKSKVEERCIRYYTDRKNRCIFWRKFIYGGPSRLLTKY